MTLKITVEGRHWKDVFPKDDVIYLSPDAEEVLEKVEATKVYVIGGIIDRGSEKSLTRDIAEDLGVESKRFPLERCASLSGKNSIVFTVNQTFEILLRASQQSWATALEAVVPKRKVPRTKSH